MPYDEMFERAECCGVVPVRISSPSSNKLNLTSYKFSKVDSILLQMANMLSKIKRWVALLDYTNDGINSFWAVLIRNSPGDHPKFDVFVSEIRPETEFKQEKSSKEFSYSSPQHRGFQNFIMPGIQYLYLVTFYLESHSEQQIWCDGFRRYYYRKNK